MLTKQRVYNRGVAQRIPPSEMDTGHLCHGDKECTGCLQSPKTYGPPPSPTVWYSAKANLKKEVQQGTGIGKSLQCLPANVPCEESSQSLEENPFMLSLEDPTLPLNTFGKKILGLMVEELFHPKYNC